MQDIYDLNGLVRPANTTELDIQRRLRKGHGELVTVKWTDLDDETMESTDVESKYYIGKITMGQTGTIVSVLAAVFANGADLKAITGRTDNVTFLNAIDEDNLGVLFACIMGETEAWVKENYDLSWVIDVIAAFLKHNDFFAVMTKVMDLMGSWNVTEEQARDGIIGKKSV